MSYRNNLITALGGVAGGILTAVGYFQRNRISSWLSNTTKKPEKRETILVGVDIEKAGALYSHPVLSVGFAIGNKEGNLLQKKKFNIDAKWFSMSDINGQIEDYGDFEPRCVDEFWAKQEANIIQACFEPKPRPPKEAWQDIACWINQLEIVYPESEYKIKFVSDNASFDIANIDYNLEKYAGRLPMRYSLDNKYRGIIAADDMLDMIPPDELKAVKERIDNAVVHDHDCVNDAHNIMLQGAEALRYKNNLV